MVRGRRTRCGVVMSEWTSGWRPSTMGEARANLDAHERDSDPDIVVACEALFDARHHLPDAAKPSEEQLEERGADRVGCLRPAWSAWRPRIVPLLD